ncbi:hypothetical protein G6F50_016011 [Rhizopus delemar]|uniref:Uncharacterized protein n=1 Tax=Rhizopus delemar TaxID=936053 RepID=A0A9P6XVF1_9FUNG|nr:hypothetical protein G6F50_016011 [Rhizopus delemar]
MPMGGDDHAAGNAVGDLGAVIAAQQVQAAIDGGGRARGRQDIPVIDVQGFPVQADFRMPALEIVAPYPVRGRRAPVQQTRFGQNEGAQA